MNEDDGTPLPASALRVVLPDGNWFRLESWPGREGSAVFTIPAGTPEAPRGEGFAIEPGAANLFSVRVVRLARPGEDTAGKAG